MPLGAKVRQLKSQIRELKNIPEPIQEVLAPDGRVLKDDESLASDADLQLRVLLKAGCDIGLQLPCGGFDFCCTIT